MTKSVYFTRALPALLLALSLSGCLKTRAQLKGEDEGPQPEKAQIEDVKPQGGYVIDELKAEITRLQGRIEDVERAQKDNQSQQNQGRATLEEQRKLEARIVELEKAQQMMLEELNKMRTAAPPADPAETFEKGKAHFDAKEYDGAIESFSSYLRVPKAKKAEDATWYRAESYFALKQYKKAINDYGKFPENFKKSKRLSQALYKIGLSFDALGMKSDAQNFYAEVVEKFPKSSEAKKSKIKLK
jgi:TolA-binding protein